MVQQVGLVGLDMIRVVVVGVVARVVVVGVGGQSGLILQV